MDRPSSARIYDYFLGGSHNCPVDRQAAEQLEALYPAAAGMMRVNRAICYLVAQGIDQFPANAPAFRHSGAFTRWPTPRTPPPL